MKLLEVTVPAHARQVLMVLTRHFHWPFKPYSLADASTDRGWGSYRANGNDDDHIQVNFSKHGDIIVHASLDMDIGDNHDIYDGIVSDLGLSNKANEMERGKNHFFWDVSKAK